MGQVRITGRRINKIHRKAVAVAALQAFGALIVPSADGDYARHLILQGFECHENLRRHFFAQVLAKLEQNYVSDHLSLNFQRQHFANA